MGGYGGRQPPPGPARVREEAQAGGANVWAGGALVADRRSEPSSQELPVNDPRTAVGGAGRSRAIAAVALAPLGASAAPHVSTRILLAILAGFLVFAGSMMLFYRPRAGVRNWGRPTEVAIGSGVGGVAGFLGGLLGVGGGNVILPALTGAGLEAKVVAGTTGFAVVFSSLSGFLGRISMGGVNGLLLGVSVTATAAGSLVGSRLMTSRLSSGQLKRLIAVVLWAVAVKIIWGLV